MQLLPVAKSEELLSAVSFFCFSELELALGYTYSRPRLYYSKKFRFENFYFFSLFRGSNYFLVELKRKSVDLFYFRPVGHVWSSRFLRWAPKLFVLPEMDATGPQLSNKKNFKQKSCLRKKLEYFLWADIEFSRQKTARAQVLPGSRGPSPGLPGAGSGPRHSSEVYVFLTISCSELIT